MDKSKTTISEPPQTKRKQYSILFLCVVAGAILAFLVYLFYAGSTLRGSQNRIVECYQEHINKADSLALHHSAYAFDNICGIQNASNRIVVDSLVKFALGATTITKGQHQLLIETISTHFREQSEFRAGYLTKFKQDSLLLCAERNVSIDHMKQMLDLHLGKVEHEYSNITIWAAILTILFLVFSFYSIFKMDELIKQGDEGVRDIRKLRDEGRASVDRFNQERTEKLNDFETKTKEAIDKQTEATEAVYAKFLERSKGIESINQKSQEQLQSVTNAFGEQSAMLIRTFGEELNAIKSRFQSDMDSKVADFNRIVEQATEMLNDLMKSKEER